MNVASVGVAILNLNLVNSIIKSYFCTVITLNTDVGARVLAVQQLAKYRNN